MTTKADQEEDTMKNIVRFLLKQSPYDYLMYVRRPIREKLRFNASQKIINNYLAHNQRPKLQIGCGCNPAEGWLNTDLHPISKEIAFLDAGKPFPLEDNVFEFICSEHVFEHLKFRESCNFLSECYRVLKPGGVLRIALPHVDFLFGLRQNPDLPIHREYVKWATESFCKDVASVFPPAEFSEIYVINNFFRDWGHQVLHGYDSLSKLIATFDFHEIQRKESGKSDHEELVRMENHGNMIPEHFNKLETLVVEATKKA